MSKLSTQLGKRIYQLRKARRLTQAALAERSGISNEFMSAIERGAKLPSLSTLQRIGVALRVGVKDLFNFDRAGFRRIQPLSRESMDVAHLIEKVSPSKRRRMLKMIKTLAETLSE